MEERPLNTSVRLGDKGPEFVVEIESLFLTNPFTVACFGSAPIDNNEGNFHGGPRSKNP